MFRTERIQEFSERFRRYIGNSIFTIQQFRWIVSRTLDLMPILPCEPESFSAVIYRKFNVHFYFSFGIYYSKYLQWCSMVSILDIYIQKWVPLEPHIYILFSHPIWTELYIIDFDLDPVELCSLEFLVQPIEQTWIYKLASCGEVAMHTPVLTRKMGYQTLTPWTVC